MAQSFLTWMQNTLQQIRSLQTRQQLAGGLGEQERPQLWGPLAAPCLNRSLFPSGHGLEK